MVTKWRQIKCSGHIVRMGEKGKNSKILSEELKQRNPVVDMRIILTFSLNGKSMWCSGPSFIWMRMGSICEHYKPSGSVLRWGICCLCQRIPGSERGFLLMDMFMISYPEGLRSRWGIYCLCERILGSERGFLLVDMFIVSYPEQWAQIGHMKLLCRKITSRRFS
jgi:hypothetical protein